MSDYNAVSDGRPDGTMVGNDSSDKIGFFGTAPIAQRSSSAQAALTLTTASAGGTGFTSATGFTALLAQVEEIRATLVALGLMKGS